MSPEARADIRRRNAELDLFKKLLDMPSMPNSLQEILNGPGSISDKVKRAYEDFGNIVPETALEEVTSALKDLTAALRNEAKPAPNGKRMTLAELRDQRTDAGVRQYSVERQLSDSYTRRTVIGSMRGIDLLRNLAPDLTPAEVSFGFKHGATQRLSELDRRSLELAELSASNPEKRDIYAYEAGRIRDETALLLDSIKSGAAATATGIRAFRDNMTQGLKTALTGLFKGDSKDGMSVFETFASSLLEAFTNSIIENFVNKISEALMNPLDGALNSLVEGVTKILSGDDNGGKGLFDKLGALFGSLFEGILSMFGIGSVAYAGTPVATGGMISGPGTGTSDSIPAMLSNGEFVINAAQTRKHLPLLRAINSGGKLSAFAEGGLVTGVALQQPSMATFEGGNTVSNTQQININITGDISRQTRSEIYGMLPQIAAGVNAHNKEQNYRG